MARTLGRRLFAAALALGATPLLVSCASTSVSPMPTAGASGSTAPASTPAAAKPASEATNLAPANSSNKTLSIGGIPDQSTATLTRAFEGFAAYLGDQTGVAVKYQPAADYGAILAAFKRGDVHLVWFGGLTGVQAREAVPGSDAIAHRPRDAEFHSKFIAQADLSVTTLADLKGLTFTFGSESSTSGHLMPRYFLVQAGIDPDKDFKSKPNYSGSHDKTWKLVEASAFQAGVLNEAVWETATKEGKVDRSKVREFHTTPPYFDYNWTVHVNVDEEFGAGTKDKLKQALLSMNPETPEQKELLDLFATDRFVETNNENYQAIREVASQLGILQ